MNSATLQFPNEKVDRIAAAGNGRKPLSEDEAAQVMWVYCRDHKAQLIGETRESRGPILSQLMQGVSVEQVFTPFFRLIEPAKRMLAR
jgi:hypothetical protein